MRLLSTFVGANSSDVIRAIFLLHFPKAKRVVDMTYGCGRFWHWAHRFEVVGVDIKGTAAILANSTYLPFRDRSFDVAVIDPPFRHAVGYNSTLGLNRDYAGVRSQRNALELYAGMIIEAERVAGGVIVKLKDTVERSRFIHNTARVAGLLAENGFEVVDKAILVPTVVLPNDPKWIRRYHFRHQESYFLVGKKQGSM